MFDPGDFGKISPVEQADALRTLIAVFATSVVRDDRPPRNAVSAEILDIVDEVPADRAEAVAQLFAMLALRLRRRARPRFTTLRLTLETALLARKYVGGDPVEGEAEYLLRARPDLDTVDEACDTLLDWLDGLAPEERAARLTAEAVAAALVHVDGTHGSAIDTERHDIAVAEFLLRTAAQYLALTAQRSRE